jgi:hypothetical protein
VVHRQTLRLKPRDPLQRFPPTDKGATVASVDVYRILEGRIVDGRLLEQWNHPDRFGVMYQPGNFPIPL